MKKNRSVFVGWTAILTVFPTVIFITYVILLTVIHFSLGAMPSWFDYLPLTFSIVFGLIVFGRFIYTYDVYNEKVVINYFLHAKSIEVNYRDITKILYEKRTMGFNYIIMYVKLEKHVIDSDYRINDLIDLIKKENPNVKLTIYD